MSLHLNAEPGDFAETVIMPGDPKRAEWIANNFLDDVKVVNTIRNNIGYTGKYFSKPVSILASGMGQPTLGIYATELFTQYGVENIIRIGTCGAVSPELKIGDCVVALSGGTDSNITYNDTFNYMAPCCSYKLLTKFNKNTLSKTDDCVYGQVLSTDRFYKQTFFKPPGVLAIDMETHYLYYLAGVHKKHALTINVVSDIIATHETMTHEEKILRTGRVVTAVLESIV